MRYVALFAPTLALVACAMLPTFSAGPGLDASIDGGPTSEDGATLSDGSVALGDARDAGDAGDAGEHVHTGNYHVFVTADVETPGAFGPASGIIGADQFCQKGGKSVNPSSHWVAFLYAGSKTARSRVTTPSKAFYTVERTGVPERLVFDDIQDTAATPKIPMNDENGEFIVGGAGDAGDPRVPVWVGNSNSATCLDWRSSSNIDFGATGSATSTEPSWEGLGAVYTQGCNSPSRLYCFEQDPPP